MLEEKDLQAIRAIIKEEVAGAKQELARDTVTLMDLEFKGRFDLLAENQQITLEKLDPLAELGKAQ